MCPLGERAGDVEGGGGVGGVVLRGEDARPWKGAVSEGGSVHRGGCGKAGRVSAGPVTLL